MKGTLIDSVRMWVPYTSLQKDVYGGVQPCWPWENQTGDLSNEKNKNVFIKNISNKILTNIVKGLGRIIIMKLGFC